MNAGKTQSEGPETGHVPVMLGEVVEYLSPKAGGVYVDGTFGAGGYARAILEAAPCTVYAIDRDPDAFERARKMAREYEGRLFPLFGPFGSVESLLMTAGVSKIDGLVLDLGVSSIQLSEAERGFSFRHDGPLDMRMGKDGLSAADVVNEASEEELADIIYQYGEERAARKIARRIAETRREKKFETTKELAACVHKVLPMHGGMKTDTATRTFQALRIHVNDELGELSRALAAAERLLKPEGRLVVVSFHSLEDGIVKSFLKERAGKTANVSRHLPPVESGFRPTFRTLGGGIAPTDEETERNPRARSARLRCGIRTGEGIAHA